MSRVCEEAAIALGAFRIVQDGVGAFRFVDEDFGFAVVQSLPSAPAGVSETFTFTTGSAFSDSAGGEDAIIEEGSSEDEALPITEESVITNT